MSSVLDRQILACRTSCRMLATLPKGLHPFAIAWDASRNRLWVAADCPSGVSGIVPCERGGVFALDASGRIRVRMVPTAGAFHPGDISVSKRRIFVSDSQSGLVLEIKYDGRVMEAVNRMGDGKSAQGTALAPDGRRLLVADYSRGVGWLDLATSRTTVLQRKDGKPLRGIDGLVRCKSVYYGIYNGASPGALVAMAPSNRAIGVDEPLGENGSLSDPTQIAYDGKRLLIVERSGWADLDKAQRTFGARIVSIPLGADCKPR